MKAIFYNVIAGGDYDLTEMLARIDGYHIEGRLTDAEREELYALAREGAAPQYDPRTEIEALWAAVRELRAQIGGSTDTGDEWPDFVQPTGAHDAYSAGDKVTYGGARYICQMDSCVWSPDVYPAAWQAADMAG